MNSFESPVLSISRVRQQGDVARALDRFRQHALVRGAHAGDTPWQDLAAFRDIRLQEPHIFEVDQVDLFDAEAANLSPLQAARTTATGHRSLIFALESVFPVAIFIV